MRVLFYGAEGRVGTALLPKLLEARHEVTPVGSSDQPKRDGHDAAIDFTRPDAVRRNVEGCLQAGIPCIVGTTGMGPADLASFDELGRRRDIACFVAPNFAVGAILMMRFAVEAAKHLPRAEIVELHDERKLDAPSGTARATAVAMPGSVPIHSVRLPGLIAHQEVLLGGEGQLLTIRHDTLSREAFAPGVLLALDKLSSLPPGVTVGLESLLE
jgi:4-hydroxy-tetrahydrodipicolinate reductase